VKELFSIFINAGFPVPSKVIYDLTFFGFLYYFSNKSRIKTIFCKMNSQDTAPGILRFIELITFLHITSSKEQGHTYITLTLRDGVTPQACGNLMENAQLTMITGGQMFLLPGCDEKSGKLARQPI
jgi:hypothetical protein